MSLSYGTLLRQNQCYPVEHLTTGENQFYNNNNNNNNNNSNNNNNNLDFVMQRHNELRDLEAAMLDMVCYDVEV